MTPIVLQYAEEAAANHSVTLGAIFSTGRKAAVVAARREIWKRLRDRGWSLTRIGEATGFDHSTVYYGISEAARARKKARQPIADPERRIARQVVQAAAAAMLEKHRLEVRSRY